MIHPAQIVFDGLGDYPWFVVVVARDGISHWFAAAMTRDQAMKSYHAGAAAGYCKGAYRVVAKFDTVKVKRDMALHAMPVEGRA